MAHVIGIDLDMNTSRAAVWNPHLQDVTSIPNHRGEYSTPFFINFDRDGQVMIGAQARRHFLNAPQDTLTALSGSLEYYKSTRIRGNDFDWQTATAIMLAYLKHCAEDDLQEPVFDAILTCPAHYTLTQRNALYDAGMIAGLNIRYLLNPSTAAAISYLFFNLNSGEIKTILVVNLGSSSLDLSVVNIWKNVFVHGSGGTADVGGLAIDKSIVEWALKQIKLIYKMDLSRNEKIKNELLLEASLIKKKLIDQNEVHLLLKDPVVVDGHPHAVDLTLSRKELSIILTPLISSWSECINQILADADETQLVGWADLDGFMLVGELSRLPILQEIVLESFKIHCPGKVVKILTVPDSEDAAVKGAALLAGTKVPYGISPFESEEKKVAAQGENLTLAMDEPEFIFYDISPHSLGIGLVDYRFYPVIKKGTAIPTFVEVPGFSNATADTTQMVAEIFEGEADLIQDNKRIGEVVIYIEPLPAGQHNHSIDFEIDISGRFSISCSDLRKEELADYVFKEDGRLTLDEIQGRSRRVAALMTDWEQGKIQAPEPINETIPAAKTQPQNRPLQSDVVPQLDLEKVPLEWHNYWIKSQSLLPKLEPANRAILIQAMDSFAAAIKRGNPKRIETCGHLLQDALLEVWM